MARDVSGLRFARSFLTPADSTPLTQELDFDLGARLGLKIHWVAGYMNLDQGQNYTADVHEIALQSLHMETDAVEDVPITSADDAFNVDTEVFFLQSYDAGLFLETSGAAHAPTPSHLFIPYSPEIVVARNITHRAEVTGTVAMACGILLAYNYVELTNQELVGVLTSRR